MPAGDGTGPDAMGPMSGRGLGYCGGNAAPGYAYGGRGFGGRLGGRGRGRGRGWRHNFHATGLTGWQRASFNWPPPGTYDQPGPTAEQERQSLEQQSRFLAETLERIRQRLDQLQSQTSGEGR